jgi:hypothetical protein
VLSTPIGPADVAVGVGSIPWVLYAISFMAMAGFSA